MQVLALLLCLAGGMGEQHAPLAVRVVSANTSTVPCCGLFELTIDLSATYDNPFDPGQIDTWGLFTPPEGPPIRVNAYLDQDFTHTLEGGREVSTAAGDPVWRIRFAPRSAGHWHYGVFAKDKTGCVSTPEASFRAVRSNDPGYLAVGGAHGRYFAFDNGRPFFAIGENMCWPQARGTFDYEEWLAALGDSGGNWIRLWTASWNYGIEWTGAGFSGVGRYNLMPASRLDRIFDLAAKKGIRLLLCLGTYGEFTTGGFFNEGQWNANPYNAANGGPCAQPADFWTNEQARQSYRQRLRYFAARYGWRTNLFAWEFWNEAQAPAVWVAEMARYLKGTGEFAGHAADAFGHLVSTTYGNKEVWCVPEIDFTMTHHYGQGDVADSSPVIHFDARGHEVYQKPHLMAEFGIDWRKSDNPYDPENKGVNLHNGLWASACSGNAGGAMLWYWEGYVHPGRLYGAFTSLRHFTEQIPWLEGRWTCMKIDTPRLQEPEGAFRDTVIAPGQGWGRCLAEEFWIAPDDLCDPAGYPGFLYAPAKPDLRTTPVFHVRYDRPGQFVVHAGTVSVSARLRFQLDGQLAREYFLSASPPTEPNAVPEYEKTDFRPEYGSYQAVFNKDYAIDIPAGNHTIQLEVTEGDWLGVGHYRLTNYTNNRFANLQSYGMTNGGQAVLWLHNADYHWKSVFENKPVPPITDAETTIHGLAPGNYTIEWWDTWKGSIEHRVPCTAGENGLAVRLPSIEKDVAARIIPR